VNDADYMHQAYTAAMPDYSGRVTVPVLMEHIKNHYYASHESVNPSRVIPVGPDIEFLADHDRARLVE